MAAPELSDPNRGLPDPTQSPRFTPPAIVGIVNLTADSFSDGGRFLQTDAAIAHALQLTLDGADIIDLGAESTHPDSERVPPDIQIARLTPVIQALVSHNLRVSIDAYAPEVLAALLPLGVSYVNDVTALSDPRARDIVKDHACKIVLMHAISQKGGMASRAAGGHAARAARPDSDPATIMAHVRAFFTRRLDQLTAAGIARQRLILDPGMGFFVGRDPQVSLAILRQLDQFHTFGLPLYICTSRKSFIGQLLANEAGQPRPAQERGAGTLATELWAALHGASFIRTHDVLALSDALRVSTKLLSP